VAQAAVCDTKDSAVPRIGTCRPGGSRRACARRLRVTAEAAAHGEPFSVAGFSAEGPRATAEDAVARGCTLSAPAVAPLLGMSGDRQRLLTALRNVLHNAFKFTRPSTEGTLCAYSVAVKIFIDVQDRCGGLREGVQEKLFAPFSQRTGDETGLGQGLSIARQKHRSRRRHYRRAKCPRLRVHLHNQPSTSSTGAAAGRLNSSHVLPLTEAARSQCRSSSPPWSPREHLVGGE
jgi:hypothetical protein